MNWLSLLGLEAFVARWRANVIEGAIAAEDRLELARLEWLDQKQRLQQMLVLLIAVTGLTVVTLVLVSMAIPTSTVLLICTTSGMCWCELALPSR